MKKLKTPVCNPLVIAIVLIVGVLLIFKIPYEDYNAGGKIINMFLAPATACLAVAIYTKYRYSNSTGFRFLSAARPDLWHLWKCLRTAVWLFGLDKSLTVSLLPKSANNPDCREHIRTGRWRRSDYGCRRYRNRNTRDICAPSYKII